MRILLSPLSPIYWTITSIRNWAFSKGILSSYQSSKKVLSVGNLSAGGTGKTPMAAFLLEYYLKQDKKVAFLSRGYGRKTKGLQVITQNSTSMEVGDEPLLIARRFSQIPALVSESRKIGLQYIEQNYPDIELVILDDAYQHRAVLRDYNILLSHFDKPFFFDHILPLGDLREPRKQAIRADHIIFTKCHPDISAEEKAFYNISCKKYCPSPVSFSSEIQKKAENWDGSISNLKDEGVILITGIADAFLLKEYVVANYSLSHHFDYADHFNFKASHIDSWMIKAEEENAEYFLITEKDKSRLDHLLNEEQKSKFKVLPLGINFLDEAEEFLQIQLNKLIDSE